jgi:hypothetical protein
VDPKNRAGGNRLRTFLRGDDQRRPDHDRLAGRRSGRGRARVRFVLLVTAARAQEQHTDENQHYGSEHANLVVDPPPQPRPNFTHPAMLQPTGTR